MRSLLAPAAGSLPGIPLWEAMDLVSPFSPFQLGDHVVVSEGRHFQDFSAGDRGVVSQVDQRSETCQVYFKHLPGEQFRVAWRNLSKASEKSERSESLCVVGTDGSRQLWDFESSFLEAGRKSADPWEALIQEEVFSPRARVLSPRVSEADAQGELTEALEAYANAMANSSLAASKEAKVAHSNVKDLEEKIRKHSQEHWLGLDCLQEKVKSDHRELIEVKSNFQKELASVNLQVQSLYEQCEAFKEMFGALRKDLAQKATGEQLLDLEHQQCKAMESLLKRWDSCANLRKKTLESQVVKLVDEVHMADHGREALRSELVEVASFNHLARKVGH